MSRTLLFFTAMIILSLAAVTAAQDAGDRQSASINGRVTLSGQPVRGIKVSLVPGPYGSPETPGRQSARTDENGRYEFKGLAVGRFGGLPPGRYVIGGSHDTTRSYYGEPVEFEVKDEDIKSLDVKLSRGASISGAVLIEGVADPAAMLRSAKIWIIPRSLEPERAFENHSLAPAMVE